MSCSLSLTSSSGENASCIKVGSKCISFRRKLSTDAKLPSIWVLGEVRIEGKINSHMPLKVNALFELLNRVYRQITACCLIFR